MYCFHALNWLRITASDVPLFEYVTSPSTRIAAEVAVKAHPLPALRLEPPLTLGPVLEVIGVDHGRG